MTILRASIEHLSTSQVLLNEYYEAVDVMKRDSPQAISAYLSDTYSGLWIAFVQGVPAGCVVVRPLQSPQSAVECKRLYVRPQFRGMGIANGLLTAIEQFALSNAAEWIYLDSKDDLKGALNLYQKRGYRPCERYNDNPQATVFFRNKLTRPGSVPQSLDRNE